MTASSPSPSPSRLAGAAWGLVGVSLILGDALARVWPYTRDALRHDLTTTQWMVLVAWIGVMLVGEGYRGFQRRFAPRATSRGLDLLHEGRGIDLLLAPLYCIGYFHAPRRQVVTSWALTAGITGLVLLVRALAHPWRGILDAGVLAGLSYGLIAVLILALRDPVR